MTLRTLVLAALAASLVGGPAAAAEGGASAPVASGYWAGFIDHWSGVLQNQNGVVSAALLLGAVCLFIITRGKWKK